MFGIALIAILAIIGGVIAYIGDKLGTKVGKKKLTIFGLRPKHTSIVVTIITGILITISTMGILTLTSMDVRTALFGMEALKKDLAALSQEVELKNNELAANHGAIEAGQRALAAQKEEYDILNLKVQATTTRLAAIARELDTVIAQRDKTEQQLTKAQLDYAAARGDLSAARQAIAELQTTKDELDGRVGSLTEAKASLQADIANLNDLTVKLKQGIQAVRDGSIIYQAGEILTTVVIAGNGPQEQVEKLLTEVIYKTNQNIIEKLDIEDKKLEVLWIAQADFDKVVTTIAQTQQDVVVRISARSNTVYGEPVIGQISVFANQHIYQAGQTIQLAIIEAGPGATPPEEAIMKFLRQVNQAAVQQGILPDPLQGTVGAITGTDFYEAVNNLKRYNGKVTITATAKADTYTVGPLKIELHIKGVQ